MTDDARSDFPRSRGVADIPRPQAGPLPPARGLRAGLVAAFVAIAFVAGVAIAVYVVKRVAWFGGSPAATAPARVAVNPQAAPLGFNPAAPLNANGEMPAAAPLDPTMLATREATLAGQLASLETRTATVTADAAAAGGQATRAEGLLVAFAARRSLDRGVGLGYVEEQLRTRFGAIQPRAVNYVIQAARLPVTLEDLRQGLDALAPDLATPTHDGWADSVRRELGMLVVLRKAGTPSPLPVDRLSRARRLLEGGQVEAARAEIARLPGAADAGNWMTAATRYVTARHALDLIEGSAVMAAAPVPPVPTAAAATSATPPTS